MNPAYWWGIAAAVLIGLELVTGTFYLLMLALGTIVGAVAYLIGLSFNWQIVCAALTAAVATGLWHFKRYKNPRSKIYFENKNALIDIGETVEVVHWNPDQTTKVRYRGAEWSALWIGEGEPQTGRCTISAIKGSQLQLDAKK